MTLEQIIEDKNNQIKRLEENLQCQREEFFLHKQKDLNEIQRLNELVYEQNMNFNNNLLIEKHSHLTHSSHNKANE